jgi:uncharacterized protein YjbI with pentapeptide repeats
MKVVSHPSMNVGWIHWRRRRESPLTTFIVKASAKLRHEDAAAITDEPDQLSGDVYRDDNPDGSLLYASDFAPFKPRADVLVLASAQTDDRRAVTSLPVRMRIGQLSKTLLVLGPRTWKRNLLGPYGASDCEAFTKLKICYEAAFGGRKSRKNPVGCGMDSDDLPLVENPHRLVQRPSDNVDPVGFGPVHTAWQPRSSLVGTYDDRWVKQRWPWFPDDFDFAYFNAAPRDQQLDGFLRGDEQVVFENLHPVHAVFRTTLPAVRARCFLNERTIDGKLVFREVPLQLDTLWIDLDVQKLVLVWRGHIATRTVKLHEIEQLLVWTESVVDAPRAPDHYQRLLAEQIRAEDAEFAEAETYPEPDDDEFEQKFVAFDQEVAEADKEIAQAEAAAQREVTEAISPFGASSVQVPLQPNSESDSPLESLRAALKHLQDVSPDEAAAIQADIADIEQVEAEFTALENELQQEFAPAITREAAIAIAQRGESLAMSDLSEMDLSGQNLAGVDATGARLWKTNLQGANLHGANLSGANLTAADLSHADLTGAVLDDADLSAALLHGAKVTGLSLEGASLGGLQLSGMDFNGAHGHGADFSGSDLAGARFVAVVLPSADFSQCVLEGADFRKAELPRAQFDAVKAARCTLEDADLTGASFSDAADFTGASFRRCRALGAVFDSARLDRAEFGSALLSGAQFSEASLRATNLDRTTAPSASFEDALLHGAVLTNSNLARASFDRADLSNANFEGSNLYAAGFWEPILRDANFHRCNLKETSLA